MHQPRETFEALGRASLPTLSSPAPAVTSSDTSLKRDRRGRVLTRREFVGATSALGVAAYLGAKLFGPISDKVGAAFSCDASNLQYYSNGTNGPCSDYAVNDGCNGCDGVWRDYKYCKPRYVPGIQAYVVDFNAPHMGCDASSPFLPGKSFAFRTNVCWGTSDSGSANADGWQWWTGVNTCGCTSGHSSKFACNDGYTWQTNDASTKYESICMTRTCVS